MLNTSIYQSYVALNKSAAYTVLLFSALRTLYAFTSLQKWVFWAHKDEGLIRNVTGPKCFQATALYT